jgi:hypothetical protein
MSGAQALVAAPKGSGAYGVQTYSISGLSLGSPGPIAYDTTNLAAELGSDGRVRVFGTLLLQNGTGEVNQVWQVGPVSGGSITPHAMGNDNMAAKGKLNLVTGASTAGSGGGSLLHKKNVSKISSSLCTCFYINLLCSALLEFVLSFYNPYMRWCQIAIARSVCVASKRKGQGKSPFLEHKQSQYCLILWKISTFANKDLLLYLDLYHELPVFTKRYCKEVRN